MTVPLALPERIAASADPVLLLHGQPGGARDWDAVRAALSGVDVHAADRPGWDGRRAPGGIAANAVAVLDALDAVGAARATLVGHSYGAAVAAWVAAEHPDRVGALVLVAPAANVASLVALDRALAVPVAGFLASSALLGVAGAVLSVGHARRWIAGTLSLEERFLRHAARALRSPAGWNAFSVEQRALIRELPELEARLGEITAPTTILIGIDDLIVPLRSARQLASQIRGARLVELERANHLLPVQRPDRVAEAITAAVTAR